MLEVFCKLPNSHGVFRTRRHSAVPYPRKRILRGQRLGGFDVYPFGTTDHDDHCDCGITSHEQGLVQWNVGGKYLAIYGDHYPSLLTAVFNRFELFVAIFASAGTRFRFELLGKEIIKVETTTHVIHSFML
jgi:hypothetical protein